MNRRQVIAGAAVVGLGTPLLGACGSSTGTAASESPSAVASSSAGGDGGPAAGGALATTADVTVGGGLFLDDPSVVITQPAQGEFHAFNRTCTHQGCPVQDIVDGKIHCGCHNSMFSMTDGSPVSGPAGAPLATVAIKVEGDEILPA
jgi:Rieske Fe-S protein